MKIIPDSFEYQSGIGGVMSNFDHEINEDVVKQIKGKPLYADYPGWNFHGSVWWEDEEWHCEIRQYGTHVSTLSADSLEDIMSEVCDKYGDE